INERDGLRPQFATLDEERRRLIERLERSEAEGRSAGRRATEHQAELVQQLDETKRELAEARMIADSARADAERAKADSERAAAARTRTEQDGVDAARRAAAAQRDLDDARRQLDAATAESAGHKRQAGQIAAELAAARSEQGVMGTRIAELERIAASVQEERRLAASERDRFQAQQSAWVAERAEMQSLLRESRAAVIKVKEAVQRANADNKQVVESLQAEIRTLKAKTERVTKT
ncbi:MAG: hypothetical protein L6R48_25640, partial [Planctomycetes bacterium]|nr:hypothetical protein [Planctomycetota bacterium]